MQNPEHHHMKSIRLVQSNPSSVNRNQLNNSTSKMQYSIPKSSRWDRQQKSLGDHKFYDLPDIGNDRSTSFGYGKRVQLGQQKVKIPSPNTYNLNSQFSLDKKKGITMGAGRSIVRSNSCFPDSKDNIPGPTKYAPLYDYPSREYSLRSRIVDNSDKWIKSVPGPGNYQTLQLLNKQLKSPNSKFKDIPSAKIGKEKRISEVEILTRINNVPGVGKYKTVQVESTTKFKSVGGVRFGSGARKGIIDDNKKGTPGPGSYKLFSDFIY